MRRREFITLLGGATAACSLAARAQQGERMRRIGVLAAIAADEPEAQARNASFLQRLGELGWTVGRNVRIDYRWSANNADELVALVPDVILATSGATVGALQQASRSVPIVFAGTIDPVGSGFVDNLARPGGNTTGFLLFEYSLSGKWLELLKQIAPSTTRVAVLRDAAIPSGTGQWGAIQSVAPSFGVELRAINVHDAGEIERTIRAFARTPNTGMILTASAFAQFHRKLIITLADRHKLPAVYFQRAFEGWKTAVIRSVRIRDGLIANNKGHKARVRIANDVATIALKSRRRGPVRTEFEYAIPYSDAEEMMRTMCDGMSLIRFDTSYRMRETVGTSMCTKEFWMAWYWRRLN
jgi:putative tryptophan/tyrosine transport system substrate-binding protein